MSLDFVMTKEEHDLDVCPAIRSFLVMSVDEPLLHRRGPDSAVILELPDGTDLRSVRTFVEAFTPVVPPVVIPPLYYTQAELDALADSITSFAQVIEHLKLLHKSGSLHSIPKPGP